MSDKQRKRSGPPQISLPVTEDSLAAAFAAGVVARACYEHHSGRWFFWENGARWTPNETQRALHLVRDFVRQRVAGEDNLARQMGKTSALKGIEQLCRADIRLAVTSEVFDRDPFLLGTPGGVVDLRLGTMRPCRATDMMSRTTLVRPAPPGAKPKRWLRFLEEITAGNGALMLYLQRLAGYALTGSTREQQLYFLYGFGCNGKTTFINVLRGIMAHYARHAAMETFLASHHERHSTELAMLAGARLVTAIETKAGRHWAEARLKALTGSDPITARFMRRDFFTYTPTFKLILVGNNQPSLRSVDKAIARRFRMIPFTVEFKNIDQELEAKLLQEAPAILRWMIEGARDWYVEGLPECPAISKATHEYLDQQDTFRHWLEEECICDPLPIDPERSRWSANALLFRAWLLWCERGKHNPQHETWFSQELVRRGFARGIKRRGMHVMYGLQLRPGIRAFLHPIVYFRDPTVKSDSGDAVSVS